MRFHCHGDDLRAGKNAAEQHLPAAVRANYRSPRNRATPRAPLFLRIRIISGYPPTEFFRRREENMGFFRNAAFWTNLFSSRESVAGKFCRASARSRHRPDRRFDLRTALLALEHLEHRQ